MSEPLLSAENIVVRYRATAHGLFTAAPSITAVDRVSFELAAGETLGIVGESGCGKSTLARALLGLIPVVEGRIRFSGQTLGSRTQRAMRPWRRAMQIIFQDPVASLDPRMTIGEIIAEPLEFFEPGLAEGERQQRVLAIMEKVGLGSEVRSRYPHEFSGGQCQRIGIARALIGGPQLVICDEAVSALDVSIRSQIINLLKDLQQDLGLSLIFIAHDLSVVRHISHRVLVMYLGRVAECAATDDLFGSPCHPYTRALIRSIPVASVGKHAAKHVATSTDIPSAANPPSGCRFRTRCEFAEDVCIAEEPGLRDWGGNRVACHRLEHIFGDEGLSKGHP